MLSHEYEILEKMASGTFGIVFKVRRITDHKTFVMKRIPLLDLNMEQRRDAAQEISVMRNLHHPCVVEQQDAFLFNEYDLCLILEYYDGGDMDARMAAQRELDTYFSFEQVMLWFVQLVLGAQYLHAHHVIHRDIKIHNVFLRKKDGSVSLGDFGISEKFNVDVASRTWAAATFSGGGRRRESLPGSDGEGFYATPSLAAGGGGGGAGAAGLQEGAALPGYGTPNSDMGGLAPLPHTPSSSSAQFLHDDHLRSPDKTPHRPPQLQQPRPPQFQQQQQQQQQALAGGLRRGSSYIGGSYSPFFAPPQSPWTGGKMEAAMKGTPLYMAPEVLQGGAASPKSDVWSLGCVLYELLALRHPFESRDLATLVMRVSRGQREPLPAHYPHAVQDIINRMLQLDAARRPSCEEILTVPCVRAYVELWRSLRTPLDIPASPRESALAKQFLAWQANVTDAISKHPSDAQFASVHHSEIEHALLTPSCPPSEEREVTEKRTTEAARAALLNAGPSMTLGSASSFSGATAGGVTDGTFFYGASGRRIAAEAPNTKSANNNNHNNNFYGQDGFGRRGDDVANSQSFPSAEHVDERTSETSNTFIANAARGVAPSESMRPYMVYDDSPKSKQHAPQRIPSQQQQQQEQKLSNPLRYSADVLRCEKSPEKSTTAAARRRQHQQQMRRHHPGSNSPSMPSLTTPDASPKKESAAAAAAVRKNTSQYADNRKAAPSIGRRNSTSRDSPDPVAVSSGLDGPLPSTSPPPPLRGQAGVPPLRTAGVKPLPSTDAAHASRLAPAIDEDALFFKYHANVSDMRYSTMEEIADAVVQMRQRVQQRMRHQRVLLDIEQLHSRHGSAPLHSMPNVLNVLATAAAANTEHEEEEEVEDAERGQKYGGARDHNAARENNARGAKSTSKASSSAISPEEVYAHMVSQIDEQRDGRQRQEALNEAWVTAGQQFNTHNNNSSSSGRGGTALFPVGRPSPTRIRQLREVAALAEAEAARERLQRQYADHQSSHSSSATPFADPTAPLRVSSHNATTAEASALRRWSAYVQRRNTLSKALTHVFDPVSLRAVYAYYFSCPVLQRDARLVRRLVPDREQWTALPMVEELVVLDRRLQPLLKAAGAEDVE